MEEERVHQTRERGIFAEFNSASKFSFVKISLQENSIDFLDVSIVVWGKVISFFRQQLQ